ncbi:MAG TPA: DUF4412 domain-containing protein [bacterium]|nr:DUF4412 domain-containing protein [bacterium]
MKTFAKTALASLLALGLGAGAVWAGQFEGEVDYHVTMGNGDQSDMTYLLKDGKARMEMTMKGHHMVDIIDLPDNKMYMLMPDQKMYMSSDIPKPDKKTTDKAGAKIKKTGKTKTILGYKTDEWVAESQHGTTSVWGAKGIGYFIMGKGPGGKAPDSSWADELRQGGFFPLEVDSKGDKHGMTMVATKVEPKSLDASLFTVPSGYKDMSDMMKNMGNMPGMPSGMPKF